jgi:hypothetical protein
MEAEDYLRMEPRTPFVHLGNERLFRRHQFSVLLGGLFQDRGVGQDGGSPSLAAFFGSSFPEDQQAIFLSGCQQFFSTDEGLARVREAQDLGSDLSRTIHVDDAGLIAEFMERLEECSAWYGERWRYYNGRFVDSSGDVKRAGENHF